MSRSRFSEQSPPVFSLWGYSKATLYGSVAFATVALMIRSGSGCRTLLFSPRFTWICKVKYFVGFAVSLVFSLSLDSTLESRFLRAWCCLLWPCSGQFITRTTKSDSFWSTLRIAFLYAGQRPARHHFLVSVLWVLVGRCLEVTTANQQDLVLSGDEGRKAKFPGWFTLCWTMYLCSWPSSENLLRPICQTVLLPLASCPHPLPSCTICNQRARYHPYLNSTLTLKVA